MGNNNNGLMVASEQRVRKTPSVGFDLCWNVGREQQLVAPIGLI